MKPSRTAVALVLTALALGVPSVAWYVVGSREAAREAAEIEQAPRYAARETVGRLVDRLAARLETLRDNESRRPYYHYQNLYYDPKGASEGASVVPSPLAECPADPFVRAYFQIDPSGKVSLPTLNDEVPELSNKECFDGQQAVRRELAPVAWECASAVGGAPAPRAAAPTPPPAPAQTAGQIAAPVQLDPGPQQTANASSSPSAQGDLRQKGQQRAGSLLQTLDNAAWTFNSASNHVYQDIKSRQRDANGNVGLNFNSGGGNVLQLNGAGAGLASPAGPLAAGAGGGDKTDDAQKSPDVVIRVDPFAWHTLSVGGVPTLAALRSVATPAGVLTQGFIVSTAAVEESFKGNLFPVRFEPGTWPWKGRDDAAPMETTSWRLVVDARSALERARAQGREVESRFRWMFWLVVGPALLAAACVVGLVRQSERLARQRSRFAASAAHELRTPLAGMQMYGEMLAEGLGDAARTRDYARRVAGEAERLGRVVANVLGFSRLERGALTVRPEPGDLGAAVRECVERQRPALEAMGARVELSLTEGLPAVRFDRDALAQMLQNLLDNAEKYSRTAADRTIRVRVGGVLGRRSVSEGGSDPDRTVAGTEGHGRGDRDPEVAPTRVGGAARPDGVSTRSRVQGPVSADSGRQTADNGRQTDDMGHGTLDAGPFVTVTDRGPGMPMALRQRFFRPFARGADPDAPPGLGLGLALAQALARAQGGELTCADAPGGGAVFTVTLPM